MNRPPRKKPEPPKIDTYLLKFKEVRIISKEDKSSNVVTSREALNEARNKELNLVLINEAVSPPIVMIVDYGKYKYEQSKLQKTTKSKVLELKAFQISPTTAIGDLNTVAKKAREALEKNHPVALVCFFRKRQLAHPDEGKKKLEALLNIIQDYDLVNDSGLQGNKIIISIKQKKK
jgi:translation initiation factor IF-3